MGGKQRDTLRPHNVMVAIAPRIVPVCKAALRRPIMGQHSAPDFSNELGKHAFQNEFLNQRVEAKERKTGAGGLLVLAAPALIRR